MATREHHGQAAAETLDLIRRGGDPWLAIGQFVDDWHRTPLAKRPTLVAAAPGPAEGDDVRWAAFLAAAVEWLCAQDGLDYPEWTADPSYRLREPWFLYPGWRLRAWQLVETPAPFKARNVFGGNRILARA
ncbi:MAG TPA: hypothetical protein VFC93_18510 [Chloroflexota bacterium]|nr:hypothetical protein [Chloroflexota bacterium]